ncbi:Gfo/Idh/MocA family oxidoreductase [Micromonospora sp. NPDC051196]|uniref:Gfo/Idh/MocA family protein n=1 Tax=Micromonospora sp. NPDC051196 TaxID=3155281 RepID=UPI00343B042D
MNLLLIGMSRFARRRVLPAVAALDEVTTLHVASAHADPDEPVPKAGRRYRDWRTALGDTDPGLVYVSSVNSDHAEAIRYALDHGHHVVVDKPALPDRATAAEVVARARSAGLVVAEATCYSYHPMFAEVGPAGLGAELTQAVAVFTPPVPAGDFRHDRHRGGGALLDTGPYLASLGRVLWGLEPDDVHVVVGDRTPDGLELSYGALARYPGGRTLVGQFGFTTTYRNSLQLLGPGLSVDIERPFSAPPDMAPEIRVNTRGEQAVRRVEPADSLRIFLTEVLRAVRDGSREFDAPLLSDARTRDRLTRAAAVRNRRA